MEKGDVILRMDDAKKPKKLTVTAACYEVRFDLAAQQWSLYAGLSEGGGRGGDVDGVAPIVCLPMQSRIHALEEPDLADEGAIRLIREQRSGGGLSLTFAADGGGIWASKTYVFAFGADSVCYRVEVSGAGKRIDDVYYCAADWMAAGPGDREAASGEGDAPRWRGGRPGFAGYYAPRFDWSTGFVFRRPDEPDSLNCQQWLSPPPFCYALRQGDRWTSCGILAEPGAFRFLGFDYVVSPGGEFSFRLDYEGHTLVGETGFRTPELRFGFRPAAGGNEAVGEYVRALADRMRLAKSGEAGSGHSQPSWWVEPMFCGWGQQRYDYRGDHNGTENGHFLNVGEYATEEKYRSYVAHMEAHGIHPGTIIIDYKWAAQDALAAPDPLKWSGMRAFIDEQHRRGRRVLLWYSPLLAEGLPVEACMTLDGRVVAADPTSERYREIVAEQIRRMVDDAPGCLNADGLKIDFTQNLASERRGFRNYLSTSWALLNQSDPEHSYPRLSDGRDSLVRTAGASWGVELLRDYIQAIYSAMKAAKPDAMLIAHTANPYFADIADVLRLNDLDGESPDVLAIMRNRAEIARLCNSDWLIDPDNDLMADKRMWRNYVQAQPLLGIPVTYYIRGIAASGEPFDEADYAHLRGVWRDYRERMARGLISGVLCEKPHWRGSITGGLGDSV
ncbi:alpha-amylase family protein [Cohnella fermenti]|uniref:Alpha-galactosidase n=1 Tax=Cohnella fermenti TaxID=2565925 RepID=A0A4S4BPB1_9BACL|nr:hypothetical protein [Cohnella fermenti]THF76561.1 hypothetical protein E6C55_18680 [Cohnella fermenti]